MPADGSETQLRMVYAMVRANRPMGPSDIAKAAGIGLQNARYHLPKLVARGVILPLEPQGQYIAQPLFQDREELLECMTPLITRIGSSIDWTSADSFDDAVSGFLTFFLAFLAFDIDESGTPSVRRMPPCEARI